MLKEERHDRILELLDEEIYTSAESLAKRLFGYFHGRSRSNIRWNYSCYHSRTRSKYYFQSKG
jgi:hypothetical protein